MSRGGPKKLWAMALLLCLTAGCATTRVVHLDVMRVIRCIDDAACEEARLWTTEDGRPDKVGEYHVVSGLRIDTSRVGDAGVFRPWGYLLPIIVAGHLKEALERTGIVGGRFVEV